MSWKQVAAFRLCRHHLLERAPREALEAVVGDLVGVQAQSFPAAELALWTRIRDLTREDLPHALWETRSLVRTWCMRGTIHLLPTSDFPLVFSGIMEGRLPELERWLQKRGLEPNELATISEAILNALSTGPVTRREVADYAARRVGPNARPWIERGWYSVVKHAAYRGPLCFGPNLEREVTLVRLENWIPAWRALPREEAESVLLRRYLRSYGPATRQDFGAWSGKLIRHVNPIWERTRDELVTVCIDDHKASILREDLPVLVRGGLGDFPSVRLLPSFDAFLLGHRKKDHFVDAAHRKQVFGKVAFIAPTVLIDGRIAGTWSKRRRGNRLSVEVDLFEEIAEAAQAGIEAEAATLGHFYDADGEVVYQ